MPDARFRDDYPPPAYAGYIWWSERTIVLAVPGRGTRRFEDTPMGLVALRIALLDLADAGRVTGVGFANVPVRKFDAHGREKHSVGDIFDEEG